MTADTNGIRLRRYTSADTASVHEAALESSADIFPWMPWCHPGYSLAEATAWVDSRERLFADGQEYSFAIVDPAGRFLGTCDLNQINRGHRVANVGYWVRTSATGRGVAPAAIRELARFAFGETDLVRLEIVCAVGNERSRRAAEKAGAEREATLRDRLFFHGRSHDAVLYVLLRSSWDALTAAPGGGR